MQSIDEELSGQDRAWVEVVDDVSQRDREMIFPGSSGPRTVTVTNPDGSAVEFTVEEVEGGALVASDLKAGWAASWRMGEESAVVEGEVGWKS